MLRHLNSSKMTEKEPLIHHEKNVYLLGHQLREKKFTLKEIGSLMPTNLAQLDDKKFSFDLCKCVF